MKRTLQIEIDGITLTVTGDHIEGYAPSWTDPGEPESFEVWTLTDSGVDVLHLHDENEIEALALEACGAEDEYARDYAADMRREDARMGMR
ncbi:hypothetical protein [Cupriavidus necator]|uniref:hypothetical protein n=1 Tax=Cupriavidus necator TaxID=106590 RepID=UPI00339D3200